MSYNFQSRKQILTLRGVYTYKVSKEPSAVLAQIVGRRGSGDVGLCQESRKIVDAVATEAFNDM